MCLIRLSRWLVVAIGLLLSTHALPATELLPRQSVDSLETKLLADAADGRLDRFTLLQAALISGGIDQAEQLRTVQERLEVKWRELSLPSISQLPPKERVRFVLAGVHRLLLTGSYKADCTEPHATVETGDFNCVTATILFMELNRRHGVATTSVAVPGHVYARVKHAPAVDIQTTCREWMDVLEGRVASAEAKALLRQMAERDQQSRELSDVELLGKVYYNRGVSLLEQQDFSGAVAILHTSLKFDKLDQPARNNLLAAYNNWALALCDQGDYAAAAAKLAEGHKYDPHYAPLLTNDLHVHQKWVLALCDRGRYADALSLLDRGYQRRPEVPLFDGGRFAVCGLWFKSLLETQRLESALAMLDATYQRYGHSEELTRQEVAAFEANAERLLTQNNPRAVNQLLAIALQRHPQSEALHKLKLRAGQ